MTENEAIKKAKSIWGKDGFAVHRDKMHDIMFNPKYKVGFVLDNHMANVVGEGDTWEIAFKNAERNIN